MVTKKQFVKPEFYRKEGRRVIVSILRDIFKYVGRLMGELFLISTLVLVVMAWKPEELIFGPHMYEFSLKFMQLMDFCFGIVLDVVHALTGL